MKKIPILALVIFTSLALIGATVWEGTAATAAAGTLPQEGLYAATNSFPLNTVVDVTNLENGKTVRVVVWGILDSPGFLIVLSQEASAQIGLQAKSIGRVRMSQSADALAFSPVDDSSTADPDHDPLAALADAAARLSTGEDTPFAFEEGDPVLSWPLDEDLFDPDVGDDLGIVDVPDLAAADARVEATLDRTPVEPLVFGADDEAKPESVPSAVAHPTVDAVQPVPSAAQPVTPPKKEAVETVETVQKSDEPRPDLSWIDRKINETLTEESAVPPPLATDTKPDTPAGQRTQPFDVLNIPEDFNWDDYDITLTPTAERPPTLSAAPVTGNDLYPLVAPVPGKSAASVPGRTPTAIDLLPVVPPIPQKPVAPDPVPQPAAKDLKPVTAPVPQKPVAPAPVPEPTVKDLKPVTAPVPQKPVAPTPVPEPTVKDLKPVTAPVPQKPVAPAPEWPPAAKDLTPLIVPIPDAPKEENAAPQVPTKKGEGGEAGIDAGSIPARPSSTAPENPQTRIEPVQQPAAEKPVLTATQKTEDELNAEAMARIASAPRVASIPPRVNQPPTAKPEAAAVQLAQKTADELNAEAMARIASAPHVASIPPRVNQPPAAKPVVVPEIPEPVPASRSPSQNQNTNSLPIKNAPVAMQPDPTPQIAKAEPLKDKLRDALDAMERGQPGDTVELRSLLEAFNRSLETEQAPTQPMAATGANVAVFSVPSIDKLEKGKYYVQLGAFSQPATVEKELTRLGISYPRRVQAAGTPDKPVYRVLVGPCSLGESNALLQRFKGLGYKDAFVKSGI
ncbi:hypothetical protein FACS1894200_02520 [Spirochaetia bacterium]|nr:hypothetical protein FACS1894200_02520 [Spirochaetia bacterium]